MKKFFLIFCIAVIVIIFFFIRFYNFGNPYLGINFSPQKNLYDIKDVIKTKDFAFTVYGFNKSDLIQTVPDGYVFVHFGAKNLTNSSIKLYEEYNFQIKGSDGQIYKLSNDKSPLYFTSRNNESIIYNQEIIGDLFFEAPNDNGLIFEIVPTNDSQSIINVKLN